MAKEACTYNCNKPTHTRIAISLAGGGGADIKISIVHRYPNKPAYVVILYTMPKTYITDMYFLSRHVWVGECLHTQ